MIAIACIEVSISRHADPLYSEYLSWADSQQCTIAISNHEATIYMRKNDWREFCDRFGLNEGSVVGR
jgi:hypothetical protein